MSSPQPPYRRGFVAAAKRKREQSSSPHVEGEYGDEWNGIEDNPPAKKPRAEHLEAPVNAMMADAIAEAENDNFERYSDRHSEVPPSDEDKAPNQKTPKARREKAIATMSRIWSRTPDTLIAESMHPRFIKQPNFLKEPQGVKLDFKDWPQGVLDGLASLAEWSVGIEEAVEYVERSFKERMVGQGHSRQSWLVAADVRDALGLAADDGFEKLEEENRVITSPVADRNFDNFH